MKKQWPKKIFVTATDTEIGKTFVSAILSEGLNAYYYKPIQCGTIPCTDAKWIEENTSLNKKKIIPEKYVFKNPLSPHLAAKLDDENISLDEIHLPTVETDSYLIVEGCGGVLVPLNSNHLLIDLIKKLNIPTLIVCRSSLGTINHTLLTISILKSYDIKIFGIVMNGIDENNAQAIEKYSNIPILAQIKKVCNPSSRIFSLLFEEHFKKYVS